MTTVENFQPAYLEEIVGDRFGTYSKYIIQDRAIPDVRDGLKPVQRRILYAMYESGNTADKPYRKSAKTVGDVMGNYHPHGDFSIYDGMVRLAQPWKTNYPLVDGHGNWGSLDDDPPAAMRYTEARLSAIAAELLRDIEKDTVPYRDNFDNTLQEPIVLPARFPNLLVNGVSGISAGFATEIPTHNLNEVIDACVAMIDRPQIELDEIMEIVKGPDFPTGGIVMGLDGIKKAYSTGRGRVVIRAKTEIKNVRGGRQQIIITEIPYQVVKSRLVTAMEMIRIERKVEGIAEVRDESGRDGLKIVIELRKDADANGILAYMFKRTDLQVNYNFNMVAIVNKTPQQLGLKQLLGAYIEHQKDVVTKRTQYDLAKAEDRAHVLEGLVKALNVLDDVIDTIKASKNRQDAQTNLMDQFAFTERQADSILTLQLYRLTNLEIHSLETELEEVEKQISRLSAILNSERRLLTVIKKELKQISEKYGVARRSQIEENVEELKVNVEVMVNPEDVLITISDEGYIKRSSLLSFQRSGGETESTGLKEGDHLRYLIEANTIEQLLIFTDDGQYYALPVHQIPEYRWKENGTPIVNIVTIPKSARIVSAIPVQDFNTTDSLYFVTRNGQVKRTLLEQYETNRSTGIIACRLGEGDEVIEVFRSNSEGDLLIITKNGMSIRFAQHAINPMGRATAGVRGIQLREDDTVIAAISMDVNNEGEVLVASDLGYAKRVAAEQYQPQNRGGRGTYTFAFKTGKRVRSNGTNLVSALLVSEDTNLVATFSDRTSVIAATDKAPRQDLAGEGRLLVQVPKATSLHHIYLNFYKAETERG